MKKENSEAPLTKKGVEKIKVAGIWMGDCNWVSDARTVADMDNADMIIFPGGGDVNPALYGEPEGRYTNFSERTDEQQIAVFKKYVGSKKLFGICRGLQLLHVMAGGKLVQDITHGGRHGLITYDGLELMTNSLHHQQVMFEGMKEGEDYVLLAWADITSPHHTKGDGTDYDFPENYKDPEVVYYPKINAIGIQGHPEMGLPSNTTAWLNAQVRKYLFNEK